MGLFSVIGKIAKAGLSAVTHGVSDKVLSLAKSVAGGKPKPAAIVKNAAPATVKDMALLNKAIEMRGGPRVLQRPAEGWGFGKQKPGGTRKARPRRNGGGGMPPKALVAAYVRSGYDPYEAEVDWKSNTPAQRAATLKAYGIGARTVKKAPRMPQKRRSGGKRTVPKGGLDLKAIAAMWRAEGKPGAWLDYIKSHSNVRK